MARPVSPPLTDSDLQGLKYFKQVLPLLDRLHDAGAERDKAHNRVLHMDPYMLLQLVFFFNPIVSSMRGLVQASHLKKVRSQLGVSPTGLGSFSESGRVFDASLIKPIIDELGAQLQPLTHDSRMASLTDLPGQLLAVDGSHLKALSKLTGAMMPPGSPEGSSGGTSGGGGRGLKLHLHFEPLRKCACGHGPHRSPWQRSGEPTQAIAA